MANSDKNIVIRPSIGSTIDQPSITFTGAGNTSITLKVLDDAEGTLSFEGYQGQVFAVDTNLSSGIIYSVNDISGLPLIDANADGTVRIGIYTGNVGIGTTLPTTKLDVVGDVLVTGSVTASSFFGNATSATYASTAGIATSVIGGIASVTSLNVSGISTLGTVQISSGIITATSGVVTYYGDGSNLTGVAAESADSYQFNTGITSRTSASLTGIGSTILTLPSTSGKQYIVHSIHASNVATGNTEVNVVGAFDFDGGERSYFAYSLPLPTGTGIELLIEPQILNPSDRITMRGLDYDKNGTDDVVEVYVTYQELTSNEYFGVGLGTVGLGITTPIGIYTSSTYPSTVQSIRLTNRTDSGGYPVTINITSGINTIRLVDNLIVPKYGSVEILETPKRIEVNDIIEVQVDQGSTIDVQVSGKQIV